MAYNYNQATLVGRLTKDPEFRSGAEDFNALHFTIAVNRPYKNAEGAFDTDFIPIILRGKLAKVGLDLLKKGSPVLIWGRINVRQYDYQDEKRWMTEILAENFQILERKRFDDPSKMIVSELLPRSEHQSKERKTRRARKVVEKAVTLST